MSSFNVQADTTRYEQQARVSDRRLWSDGPDLDTQSQARGTSCSQSTSTSPGEGGEGRRGGLDNDVIVLYVKVTPLRIALSLASFDRGMVDLTSSRLSDVPNE